MDWNLIITFFIGGGLGGVIAAYIAIRKLPGESRKMDADATGVLSKAFVELLNATQAERVANALEREAMTKRIDTLEMEQDARSIARDKEIAEIKAAHKEQITELQVRITDNGLETQKKITEVQEQAKESNRKYRIIKGIAIKVIRALQENDPPIPVPELNGDIDELGESGLDLPLTPEQRARLKGRK